MTEITKIVIDINGKMEDGKLSISLEEAKALKNILDTLFEKDKEYIYVPYTVEPYRIYPYSPSYPQYPYYKITWSDTTGTINCSKS
jgi:hypothetical protein